MQPIEDKIDFEDMEKVLKKVKSFKQKNKKMKKDIKVIEKQAKSIVEDYCEKHFQREFGNE
jgi:tetrahydromethanopterin S-methyltransferase subunit A